MDRFYCLWDGRLLKWMSLIGISDVRASGFSRMAVKWPFSMGK